MKNLKFLFLFFASVIITITSCKDDDDDNTDNNKETINIGLIVPMAGYPEYSQNFIDATNMAINEINTNGGVLGKDLKLVIGDGNADVNTAIEESRKLIDEHNVISLSLTNSSKTLGVFEEVMNTEDILLIAPTASAVEISSLEDKNLVWRTMPSDAFQGKIAADYVNNKGVSEVSIMYINNSYGSGLSEEFKNHFESLGGTITTEQPYEEMADYVSFDFEPVLDLLFADKPEFVYIITKGGEAPKIFTQINSADYFVEGYKPEIMSADATKIEALTLNSPEKIIEGMIGTVPIGAISENFDANFKAFSGFETVMNATRNMYDAIYLMAYAMLSAESSDPNIFKSKMQEVSKDGKVIEINEFAKAKELIEDATDINYDGASGKIDFDENGDVTSGTYEIWKVVNSEFVTVTTIDFP